MLTQRPSRRDDLDQADRAAETYHTLGEAEIYGASTRKVAEQTACCAPRPETITMVQRSGAAEKCC